MTAPYMLSKEAIPTKHFVHHNRCSRYVVQVVEVQHKASVRTAQSRGGMAGHRKLLTRGKTPDWSFDASICDLSESQSFDRFSHGRKQQRWPTRDSHESHSKGTIMHCTMNIYPMRLFARRTFVRPPKNKRLKAFGPVPLCIFACACAPAV